ncbi:hypothetical protein CEXT_702531 [Caerostris extrusa]|uniref:Uncharacterized protein n=1 Tax=Caerostris extrusa TaxID=172846 RepID=A0AAV4TFJ7_CAEEX|nr:hypothetical protein CEXT_702531 [Caerostris extrusa]
MRLKSNGFMMLSSPVDTENRHSSDILAWDRDPFGVPLPLPSICKGLVVLSSPVLTLSAVCVLAPPPYNPIPLSPHPHFAVLSFIPFTFGCECEKNVLSAVSCLFRTFDSVDL